VVTRDQATLGGGQNWLVGVITNVYLGRGCCTLPWFTRLSAGSLKIIDELSRDISKGQEPIDYILCATWHFERRH